MHIILQFWYELKKEKMRMFLTILAICWGSANVVLMLSVGEGLFREFGRGMRGMGGNIIVVWPGQTSKPWAGFPVGRRIHMNREDVDLVRRSVTEIASISVEYAGWDVTLKYGDKIQTTRLRGVEPCYGGMRNLFPQQGGRFINDIDEREKRRVIFIGNELRDQVFGDSADAVGKVIQLNDIPFTVVGVMREKSQNSMYFGPDKAAGFIPASTFMVTTGINWVSNYVYCPAPNVPAGIAEKRFRELMASRHRFDPSDEDTYNIWGTAEMTGTVDKVMRGIQLFVGIIGALTLLIAGIGVANIMYVVIKERTREIGIKIAVGAKPRYIIAQIVGESLITVVIGGALGILLAMGGIRLITMIPIQNEVADILTKPVFSGLLALICSIIIGLIGLLSGYFPARRASRIDPVEALRYE